ncbi:MAG: glycosyltransferase [Actinomycetaceae bacterium]|nr:glycosyltransferase [Actinomycetaceae bacterium]
MKQCALLIPVFNSPIEPLRRYLQQLTENGCEHIILVDDGSTAQCHTALEELAEKYHCKLLTHPVNLGKGAALKTGFGYLLENMCGVSPSKKQTPLIGVICVDSDGQHAINDVMRVYKTALEAPERIIFGARDFSLDHVPARSRFGNVLTCTTMRLFHGISLTDTQTGLRYIPMPALETMCSITGNRFEYETNMLVAIARHKLPFIEIPIDTVYIEENAGSHFRPIRDSIRIYFCILAAFFRFTLSSLSAAAIDFGVFSVVVFFLQDIYSGGKTILLATVVARIVSSLYNFMVNRQLVFHSHSSMPGTIIKYYSLAILQLVASAYLVTWLWHSFGAIRNTQVLVKAVVDLALFFMSFYVQRRWIFPARNIKRS